ncbi:hypothetical protein swp_1867 [Shewanella piezotolerans WP3]|uniref:Uncharacterized protein n=1 Tax=Shewanella piezotolerans (strain WP3 / JCM 13877) TaxID=225849 RepID=B8CLH8_SHEPW|nr:hypothetical protein swp_1867 [Shewanella piezotolerans WP3]
MSVNGIFINLAVVNKIKSYRTVLVTINNRK